jgi:hypothetical protein
MWIEVIVTEVTKTKGKYFIPENWIFSVDGAAMKKADRKLLNLKEEWTENERSFYWYHPQLIKKRYSK